MKIFTDVAKTEHSVLSDYEFDTRMYEFLDYIFKNYGRDNSDQLLSHLLKKVARDYHFSDERLDLYLEKLVLDWENENK